MAQAIRLSPFLGLLSKPLTPMVNCSTLLKRSIQLHHTNHYTLPKRCLFVPSNNNNQLKLISHLRLYSANQSLRQSTISKPRNSINFSTGNSSKNNLTESENIRYWETFEAEMKQLTLIQRYKKMFKEFWYVGIPVVGITSALWLATFYLIAASGYVKPLVSKLRDYGVPETIAKALESEKMGPLAIAIVMYKLATPARYAVSIAGTVKAIKILLKRGLIKPVPPKDKLKEIVLKKVYEKSKTQK